LAPLVYAKHQPNAGNKCRDPAAAVAPTQPMVQEDEIHAGPYHWPKQSSWLRLKQSGVAEKSSPGNGGRKAYPVWSCYGHGWLYVARAGAGEKLEAHTDIFSLGLVLYEMATGLLAFSRDTAAVVHDAIVNRTPAPARTVNPELPAILPSRRVTRR